MVISLPLTSAEGTACIPERNRQAAVKVYRKNKCFFSFSSHWNLEYLIENCPFNDN